VKPIRYHEEAYAELVEAIEWYDAQRAGLGAEFNAAVEKALDLIQHLPTSFALHDGIAIRRYVLQRFPYLIRYQECDEVIWILAVAHQRRDPNYWKYRHINDQ
jgi:toxin ParE1/3/4